MTSSLDGAHILPHQKDLSQKGVLAPSSAVLLMTLFISLPTALAGLFASFVMATAQTAPGFDSGADTPLQLVYGAIWELDSRADLESAKHQAKAGLGVPAAASWLTVACNVEQGGAMYVTTAIRTIARIRTASALSTSSTGLSKATALPFYANNSVTNTVGGMYMGAVTICPRDIGARTGPSMGVTCAIICAASASRPQSSIWNKQGQVRRPRSIYHRAIPVSRRCHWNRQRLSGQ